MNPLSIQEIIKATDGILLKGDAEYINGVCTDTRKIQPGALFVPLAGERFDAHEFIEDALQKGCTTSLTARRDTIAEGTLIFVKDTQKALGDLAAYYRRKFALPVVSITGSVGKTTTKELTASVLEEKLTILKTAGNFNNEIGLPLTLFQLEDSHEAAVIEMGMSGFGEIDRLSFMADPKIVIMTNIGLSHIENLGSQENIYRAKTEFLNHFPKDGIVVINGDDPILLSHSGEIPQKTIIVGTNPDFDLVAEDIIEHPESLSFTLSYQGEKIPVTLQVPGAHNAINALLACAAGLCLDIPLSLAAHGLSTYTPKDKRMQFIRRENLTIINDCYNAAPASIKAALHVLQAQSGRKIAVLGDVKELGAISQKAHYDLGADVFENKIDLLFTLGEEARHIAAGALDKGMKPETVISFTEIEALIDSLKKIISQGDTVLVKASRAMHLEQVTEALTEISLKN